MFRKILNSSLNSNRCKENYKILLISIIEQNMRNLPYSEVLAIFVLGYLINVTITVNTMDPNHFVFAGDNVRGWPTCSWGCNFNGYPRTLVPHKQWWRHINLIICRKHFKSVFYMFELKTSLRRIPIFCLYWRIG